MSRRDSANLRSPVLFSADDRLVDSVPDRNEVSFPPSNFPYVGFNGGAGPYPNIEPSEIIYSHSHLLETLPGKLPGPPGQQSRVGIIQSFQIKPESPQQPTLTSPVETSRKAILDALNGTGAKTLRSHSQTSLHTSQGQSPSPSGQPNSPTSAAQVNKREHSNEEGGLFSLPQRPSRFEDVETSSILSMEQLTETLNELPTPNLIVPGSQTNSQPPLQSPEHAACRGVSPSLSHGDALDPSDNSTPTDSGSVTSLCHSDLPPVPHAAPLQQMPPHIQPGKGIRTNPSSPASSYARHSFQFTRNADPYHNTSGSLLLPPPSPHHYTSGSLLPPPSPGEVTAPKQREEDLEEQLSSVLKVRAHLEGQLESVLEECKALLHDRAGLQSKVARTEAALREAERKIQEQTKAAMSGGVPPLEGREGQLREELRQMTTALQKEQQLASGVQEALDREREGKQKALNELAQCKRKLTSMEPALKSSQEQCLALQGRLDQKSKEKEAVEGRLLAAGASLKALEESKLWLSSRLDDAHNLNMKLQSETRDSKTTALAHSIRADQLRKENTALQAQIAELHRGMLRDKEALVGQLEVIEADMLSREEACEQLAASRLQIEDMVRGKAEEVQNLSDKLAESEMQRGELGEELAEARAAIEQITQSSLREKSVLVGKLSVAEQEMAGLEASMKALEKLNAAMQERVRQAETAAISSDGVVLGLRETCSTLQRELDACKVALDAAEEKLEIAGKVNEEVEAALNASLEQEKAREAQVKGLLEGQRSMGTELQALRSALVEREREVAQRTAELGAVDAQSKDIMDAFRSLQEHFQVISEDGGGVAQRDQTIAALNTEKETLERQLVEVKEERNKVMAKLEQLQQEKARLLGELEGAKSSDLEEFRRAVQAKAVLESELSLAKLTWQQELAKGQKRAVKLEAELKSVKDALVEREKEYHTLQERQGELVRNEEAHAHTQSELQKTKEQLEHMAQAKREVDTALQREEEQVATLQVANDNLSKNNHDLLLQLHQEVSQRSEVERASGLVTLKLKQNAEENERRLQEQVSGLTLEVERLKGRLSGISSAQLCMRDHAGALEAALATRESSLVKLSTEAQRAQEEREEEERRREATISRLEQSVEATKEELQRSREKAGAERKAATEMVERLEHRMVELREQHGEEVEGLRGKMEQLMRSKEELQVEVGELRVQVVTSRTAADMAKQDWANKSSHVEALQKELEATKAHWRQAQEEAQQLREQLRLKEEQHMAELEVARRPLVSTPLRRGPSSNDMSTISNTEGTDSPRQQVAAGMCCGGAVFREWQKKFLLFSS